MNRSKSESFVLKLPLRCEPWQQDYLDKVFRVSGNMYNNLVADRKKALFEMEKTVEWRSVQSEIKELLSAADGTPTGEQKATLDALYSRKRNILNAFGFSEYAFMAKIQRWREHHRKLINTHVAQKIASSVWKQFEAYFYGNGKTIHFKGWESFFSIEGKNNETGIRFVEAAGVKLLRIGKVSIPVCVPDTPYVNETLGCRVKYCRISRIPWRGKRQWLYTLQLVLEGTPPQKERPAAEGPVGIDIGTQTIAVVGDNNLMLEEMAPSANMPHAELRRIQRAMDRSRRAMNPEMFKTDGTIKPINQLPPECVRNGKRLWKDSRRYRKLRQEKRYLSAKLARIRRCQHNVMANRVLTYGDVFFVETMRFSALQKRVKPAVDENGRHKRSKRFGKSIANKAPATLVNIIEAKATERGGQLYRIKTHLAKASQYDHTDNRYHKKKLSQRWTILSNGERVQRDLYSALLLQNTVDTLDGFDQVAVEQRFTNFKQMHDTQIEKLTHIQTPSSTGVNYSA